MTVRLFRQSLTSCTWYNKTKFQIIPLSRRLVKSNHNYLPRTWYNYSTLYNTWPNFKLISLHHNYVIICMRKFHKNKWLWWIEFSLAINHTTSTHFYIKSVEWMHFSTYFLSSLSRENNGWPFLVLCLISGISPFYMYILTPITPYHNWIHPSRIKS